MEFHPNNRCQGIGCITQQVKVAMTPNLNTLEAKDIHITGYLYVDEHIMWNQDSLETKVNSTYFFYNLTFTFFKVKDDGQRSDYV